GGGGGEGGGGGGRVAGAQVGGGPGEDVGVHVDRGQVHRRAEHRRGALGQGAAQDDADEVAVQGGRHPRGVGIPVEDVERRGPLCAQGVVDPVGPDQVVRPQPGEHLGERAAIEGAAGR